MTLAATRTALPLAPFVNLTTGLALNLARASRALALATISPQHASAATPLSIAITSIPLERSIAVVFASAPKLRSGTQASATAVARPGVAADIPVEPRRTPQSDPQQHRSAPQAVTRGASTPGPIPVFAKATIEEPLLTAAAPDAEAPLVLTARKNTSSQSTAIAAASPQRAEAQVPTLAARQEDGIRASTTGSRARDRRGDDAPQESRPRTPWQRLPRSLFSSLQAPAAIGRSFEGAPRILQRFFALARRGERDTTPAMPSTHANPRGLMDLDAAAAPAIAVADASPALLIPRHLTWNEGALTFARSAEAASASTSTLAEIRAPSPWDTFAQTTAGTVVFGLGRSGGEAAPDDSFQDEETTVAERLTGLLLEQLRAGPGSLASELFLVRFNAGIGDADARLSGDDWKHALRAILRIAVRHTPAFDEGGARLVSEIQADASRILGISPEALIDWEGPLEFEAISAQLFTEGRSDDLAPDLISVINEQMGFLAGLRIRTRWDEPAIPLVKDTALQWMIARVSNLAAEQRGDAARELIEELQARGSKALAARALSLILRNSALSERLRRDEGMLPRWSREETMALIRGLMNDATWEVASHRAFRRDLTGNEHLLINALIEEANPVNILGAIGGIDVTTQPEALLWDAIEASGQAHAIFMDALQKMIQMSEKLRCDSNAASLRVDLH